MPGLSTVGQINPVQSGLLKASTHQYNYKNLDHWRMDNMQ